MSTVKDQAICIRRQNYSESSQIVTLFGRASGKVRAIAKGSRRAKGKFGGGVDTLSVGAIIFAPPRGDSSLATLVEFELTESFPLLRKKLLPLNCGQYAAELVAQFTADLDPHEQLYDAFIAMLGELSQATGCETILLNFELDVLREVGLSPAWDKCCSCGATPTGDRVYFSSSGGGLLCRDCEPVVAEKRYLEPGVLQILQNPRAAEKRPPALALAAHNVLWYHIRELLGKETATMLFVNRLLNEQRG